MGGGVGMEKEHSRNTLRKMVRREDSRITWVGEEEGRIKCVSCTRRKAGGWVWGVCLGSHAWVTDRDQVWELREPLSLIHI